jgi:hypothetical protein
MSKNPPAAFVPPPLPVDFPPRPRRLARLVLEIEADTPDELRRSMQRALSRIGSGCEEWVETQERANGLARLSIDESGETLAGLEYCKALERWQAPNLTSDKPTAA